ncbi:MAG: amidase [Desulfobacterales bacterium]|nr:MAG: amidase [Desulfobacterales bacterium]
MQDELLDYDALALGELTRKGEIQPTELLNIVIARIERLNPRLNAVIHKMYAQAREAALHWTSAIHAGMAADAVFCGVPFLLKDLIAECRGAPFHEGSLTVKGYVSKVDSELVRRQKAGGLIVVGKTNTPEFGCLPTTEPALYGPTCNPWDPRLTPGGGSIRIPASCCGLFGLKPTRGRNPLGPLFGDLGSGIVQEHAVTRTVRDSAALLDLTFGPDVGDPYYAPPPARPFQEELRRPAQRLKIGFLTAIPAGWSPETRLHPDCENAVEDAARLCESLGHRVEEIAPDRLSHPNVPALFGVVFSGFVGQVVAYWEKELGKKIGEDQLETVTWSRYQAGRNKTGADYLVCLEEIQRFARKIARWYHEGKYDLLLSPTLRIPPTTLGAFHATLEDPMGWLDATLSFTVFTRIQNLTGQPAMSVPLFWNDDHVPIGVQFAGRFGDEATLFRLAAQLEQARPWGSRTPAIHCRNLP